MRQPLTIRERLAFYAILSTPVLVPSLLYALYRLLFFSLTPLSPLLLPRKPRVAHQFTIIRKLGFPDGVRCWCGAELTFKPHAVGQMEQRTLFLREHAECPPAKEVLDA
jgi:hypothetical protein